MFSLNVSGTEPAASRLKAMLTELGEPVAESTEERVVIVFDAVPTDEDVEQLKARYRAPQKDHSLVLLVAAPNDAARHEQRYAADRLETVIAYLAIELAYRTRVAAIWAPVDDEALWPDIARSVAFAASCTALTGQVLYLPDPKPGSVAVA